MGDAYKMNTIIIVDRIGDRSGIVQMAQKIEGKILRMSDRNWVLSLSDNLKEVFESESIGLPSNIKTNTQLNKQIKQFMDHLDIANLLE